MIILRLIVSMSLCNIQVVFEICSDFGRVPPTNQGQGVRPQSKSIHKEHITPNIDEDEDPHFKDQAPNLPQQVENSVLPHLQHFEQRMRQTFSKPKGQPQSSSEVNVVQNFPRNNDNDGFDGNNDPNNPPPVSTSSSGPTVRTIKGNYTKHDNSEHKLNISSFNVEDNEVIDSFNNKRLCRSCFWRTT
jgi:activator of HSP90 ATPase